MSKASIERQLQALGNIEIASHSQGFLKRGRASMVKAMCFLASAFRYCASR